MTGHKLAGDHVLSYGSVVSKKLGELKGAGYPVFRREWHEEHRRADFC